MFFEWILPLWIIFGSIIFIISFVWTIIGVVEMNRRYGPSESDKKFLRATSIGMGVAFVWPLLFPAALVWFVVWMSSGIRKAWA